MTGFHLGDQSLGDVIESERAALFPDHRVKEHLKEHVAQLLAR